MTNEQIRELREKLDRVQDLRWRNNAGAREEREAAERDLLAALPVALDALEAARAENERLRGERDAALEAYRSNRSEFAETYTARAAELTRLRAFRDALTEEEWESIARRYIAPCNCNGCATAEAAQTKLAKALEGSK